MRTTAAFGAGLACFLVQHVSATTEQIKWTMCQQNATIPIECGTLAVPLDYTDIEHGGTLNLELVRVNATKKEKKGSIIFNPGGPGEPGRNHLTGESGRDLLRLTGGNFDLVTFDPRGTGQTMLFECGEIPEDDEYEETSSLPSLLMSMLSKGKRRARQCLSTQGVRGELIGTVFVARDMMHIVDALGGDRLLNYWGFSYGTILGATAAKMFPDRMGRVVLDGVMNPTEYWSGRYIESATNLNATFGGFAEGCLARPSVCPLAGNYIWPSNLLLDLEQLVADIRRKHSKLWTGYKMLSDAFLRETIFRLLYWPAQWTYLAYMLDAIARNDSTAWMRFEVLSGPLSRPVYLDSDDSEAILGIRCGDSDFRAENLGELRPLTDEILAMSPVLGDPDLNLVIGCATWKLRAKERLTTSFDSVTKTSHPILLLSNRYDPVTPLVSAKNMSASFADSVVLEKNAYGHTSMSEPSICTARAVCSFFANGTLPAKDTVCNRSLPIFHTSEEARDLFTEFASEDDGIDEGDVELLATMSRIGKNMRENVRFF